MEAKLRFGVRSEGGRTSNVWTCWTYPKKGDVYLTSDVLGKALKLSDHPKGRSHIAYHYEKRDELFTPETLPKERFVLKQDFAERADVVCRLVACVFFPAGSPRDTPRKASDDTIWLPEAPEGHATEVVIFRFNAETLPNTWPGMREVPSLVAQLPLPGASCLSIVWRLSTFQMPPTPKNTGTRGLFKGRTCLRQIEPLFLARQAPRRSHSLRRRYPLVQAVKEIVMALYFLEYDLRKKRDYQTLYDELARFNAVRYLESAWCFKRVDATPAGLRNYFAQFIDPDDGLMIAEVADWAGRSIDGDPNKL